MYIYIYTHTYIYIYGASTFPTEEFGRHVILNFLFLEFKTYPNTTPRIFRKLFYKIFYKKQCFLHGTSHSSLAEAIF